MFRAHELPPKLSRSAAWPCSHPPRTLVLSAPIRSRFAPLTIESLVSQAARSPWQVFAGPVRVRIRAVQRSGAHACLEEAPIVLGRVRIHVLLP